MLRYASFFIACASLLALGCQGQKGDPGPRGQQGEIGPAGTSPVVEGTRLYGRWEAGTDGSRRMVGWYDDQLKVPCSFARATDGIVRCLPQNTDEMNESEVVYTSPDCSSAPLLAYTLLCDNPDGAVPDYVRFRSANACEGWHVRPVLDPVELPATVYTVDAAHYCNAMPSPMSLVYSLGEDVPPETFVQGGGGVGL